MSDAKRNIAGRKENPEGDACEPSPEALARRLAPVLVRRSAAAPLPERAGSSFFYELDQGWETRILLQDSEVYKVYTVLALEESFANERAKVIFIPRASTVTRAAALRVCRCHGAGKTVFYEVKGDEP
ncbi:MAG: hypothetical protein HY370_01455 [Proteobacteria bacterium]|nr:hypothetical protein [Pseudomonadota bacterium]